MNDFFEVVTLSLILSSLATILASLIGVPLGIYISISKFKYKRFIKRIVFTFMSMPPVVLGLIVLIVLSSNGIFSKINLLFTKEAIVIAQTFLILPIIVGNIITSTEELSLKIIETSKTLGGKTVDYIIMIILETKNFIITAIVLGFSRAISEAGSVILVGGNIKGSTRVMTSYITLNSSMGNRNISLLMGLVLLIMAYIVNLLLENLRNEN